MNTFLYEGSICHGANPGGGGILRAALATDASSPYGIPLESGHVWDARSTNIVATTGANDDLALVTGTFLTTPKLIQSGDSKAASTTRKVGYSWAVPAEYRTAAAIAIAINCGMVTTVSDTSATIDVQVVRTAAPTVDICETAAQSINSLTAATKTFTLTPTNVVPGDIFDIVVTIAIVDSATATAVIGSINTITVLASIQG